MNDLTNMLYMYLIPTTTNLVWLGENLTRLFSDLITRYKTNFCLSLLNVNEICPLD